MEESHGAMLIEEERHRQIDEEGWTSEHDDQHMDGQLAMAGICYAFDAISVPTIQAKKFVYDNWPWERKWWKPTPDNTIRQLTKAGALIAAEIDKLERHRADV